jgi:hypothetical protein
MRVDIVSKGPSYFNAGPTAKGSDMSTLYQGAVPCALSVHDLPEFRPVMHARYCVIMILHERADGSFELFCLPRDG